MLEINASMSEDTVLYFIKQVLKNKLTTQEIQALVKESHWFNCLDDASVSYLSKHAQQKIVKKKSYLYSIGDYTNEIYCLVNGRIRITMTSSEGQVFAVTDLDKQVWFGEASLVHDKHRLLDAVAKEDSLVLSFPKSIVQDLCEKFPQIYKQIFKVNVMRTRGLYELLGGMLFYPLRARLAGRLLELIKDHGDHINEGILLDVKLNQNDFARFSMGSRQSVNKIFREWYNADIVVMHKQKYLIKDLKALRSELFGYTGDLF